MRIAHIPFSYYPDAVGGTEVYVSALAREQQNLGDTAVVVAPGTTTKQYEHEGIAVHRFAVSDDVGVDEVYVRDRSVDQKAFDDILDRIQPDIVHVHGYTPTINRGIVASIKQRGIKLVFTYHTPTATCVRGTLMLFGATVCDGMLIGSRCTACSLQARGVPVAAASALSMVPSFVSRIVPSQKARTALRLRQLIERRHEEIKNFLGATDYVVAPAAWAIDVLRRVGVAEGKMHLNRQGVFAPAESHAPHVCNQGTLRLVFLGRLDATKGLHVVLDAFSRIPDADVSLEIFPTGRAAGDYVDRIKASIERDARVSMRAPLKQADVVRTLTRFDALVVPSQWMETGPLVVLEAFEAGIPVIGSDLGGIAELVENGTDGVLVSASDINAWAQAISTLASDDARYAQLAANVRPARTMKEVAVEMSALYRA